METTHPPTHPFVTQHPSIYPSIPFIAPSPILLIRTIQYLSIIFTQLRRQSDLKIKTQGTRHMVLQDRTRTRHVSSCGTPSLPLATATVLLPTTSTLTNKPPFPRFFTAKIKPTRSSNLKHPNCFRTQASNSYIFPIQHPRAPYSSYRVS